MKKILSIIIAAFGLCAFAKTDVAALTRGANVYVGSPAKAVSFEAVSDGATGTVTVKRIIDTWSYSTAATTVTNSFTNSVSWTSETVTLTNVSIVADTLTVTNAVYTNIVPRASGLATNVVYDIRTIANGSHPVTNEVTVTRPVWTTSYVPFATSSVTNDVISHTVYTNTVGTITLSNHVGTMAPSNATYLAGGDTILIEAAAATTVRLYTEAD